MLENNLYKDRSYSSCINAAYELMYTNITTIFKKTWTAVLVYSIIFAVNTIYLGVIVSSFTTLAILVVRSWIDAIVISLLNEKKQKNNFFAIIRIYIFYIGVFFLYTLIIVAINYGLSLIFKDIMSNLYSIYLPVNFLILLILFIAFIPVIYLGMKYLIQTDTNMLSVFKRNYNYGWKYCGFIAMVILLVFIITIAIYFVVTMPLTISLFINRQNTIGIIQGDANGLPAYYGALNFIICTVVIFFMNYISIWWILVMYYMYGSIEAKCMAKNNYTNNGYDDEKENIIYRS